MKYKLRRLCSTFKKPVGSLNSTIFYIIQLICSATMPSVAHITNPDYGTIKREPHPSVRPKLFAEFEMKARLLLAKWSHIFRHSFFSSGSGFSFSPTLRVDKFDPVSISYGRKVNLKRLWEVSNRAEFKNQSNEYLLDGMLMRYTIPNENFEASDRA